MPRLPPFLFVLDQEVRRGNASLVRRELRRLTRRKIAREFLADHAALCRRVNLPQIVMQLLHPVVRPKRPLGQGASARERAEYASALIKVGANEEGEALLDGLDAGSLPDILFFRVMSLVSQWRYRESIPLIEGYLQSPQVSSYQKLVGQLNLAAALVHERRHAEADAVIAELVGKAKAESHLLVYGNAYELSAQNAIGQGRWSDAEDALQRASKALARAGGLDALFVLKWKVILQVARSGAPRRFQALDVVTHEAVRCGHWETVRECDRFRAVGDRDERLLTHVYFGTPFEDFRKSLLLDFGSPVDMPPEYDWSPGGHGKGGVLSLSTGAEEAGKARLKVDSASHRLLSALACDFYRPIRLAAIHEKIFSGECFNPVSSPLRVYQAIRRLRSWLAKGELPLAIDEREGAYRLIGDRSYRLRVSRRKAIRQRHAWYLHRLRRAFDTRPFGVTAMAEVLGLSRRSANRVLVELREQGSLSMSGAGSSTSYVLVEE